MKIERRSFLKGLAALPLASAACSDSSETNVPARPVTDLKILAQSWGTSLLIGKIAELLLREQLGVTAAVVPTPESGIWQPLSSGTAHACLEVWPLRNNAGVAQFVDTGRVSAVGTLGVGRSAFFVPDYVLEKAPELATPAAPAGLPDRLANAGITELLVGPGDWITPTPGRMAALGIGALPVRAEATEKSFLTSIEAAYTNGQPFMTSLWYPHPIHSRYALRAVGLPGSNGCPVNADVYGCDYPAETILKVAAPGLQFTNRDVFAFLNAFAPPLDDMIALLVASGDAPEVLARAWIKAKTVVWTPWINAAKGQSK